MTSLRIWLGSRMVLVFALGVVFLCPAKCFADDLRLSVGLSEGGQCAHYPDKVITVKHARTQSLALCLMLTNNSSSSQTIYWETAAGDIAVLSFKYYPESGRAFIVKRKEKPGSSTQVIKTDLVGGASLKKTVVLDPEEWENRPVVEAGKVKKFKIRAIFDNDGSKIYSPEYTLILDGR